MKLEKRLTYEVTLLFSTPFHIGSGKSGELLSDMGILKDHEGKPLLPGSTLKGTFRSTVEQLAHAVGARTCLLDSSASGIECVSCQKFCRENEPWLKEMVKNKNTDHKLRELISKTCDVCQLFGSPYKKSKIFFSDGALDEETWLNLTHIRDGVVIDRDSGTAVDGFKYDYETTSPGLRYTFTIILESPGDMDELLVKLGILEWKNGVLLGGFTSRGLGRASVEKLKFSMVDFSDPRKIKQYLLGKKEEPLNEADYLVIQA